MTGSDISQIKEEHINEFQPEAISLLNSRLPWWARWGVGWLFVFAMSLAAWAVFCRLDIIVQAPGVIVSESPTIEMRPLEHAAIREIKVKTGDTVRKGQELIVFDPVFNAAEEARLAYDVERYTAHLARLEAELGNRKFVLDAGIPSARWENSLYETRKKLYDERLGAFSENIERLGQYAADKEEQLKRYKEIEESFTRKPHVVSLRDLNEIGIARIQAEADIKSLNKEKMALIAEKNAFMEDWHSKLLEEIVHIRQELVRAEREYEKISQLVSYVSLNAPEDAIVHKIAPVSHGSAVREAEPLIILVPLHEGMEAVVEIPASQIGRVRTGQTARLKLNAFPFQQYGTLDGTVAYISRDTFTSDKNDKQPWYQARIRLDKDQAEEKHVFLIPGMEVQAEILAGKRRIIEYALHPLIKVFDEALREP